VGWLIAMRCNLLVVGVHGRVKRQENYLVWTLAGLPELQDVDVLGKPPLAVAAARKRVTCAAHCGCCTSS
jgi:hypothetical protein